MCLILIGATTLSYTRPGECNDRRIQVSFGRDLMKPLQAVQPHRGCRLVSRELIFECLLVIVPIQFRPLTGALQEPLVATAALEKLRLRILISA
jgi:hypothetical protein